MKNAGHIIDYLLKGEVEYLFGIPAGSVNAIFDELYDRPALTPIISKHEGAASFMAAAYAKYSGKLGVVIGCSGPGAMNLVSGAANAMREQIPLLIITGSVPVSTQGWNASQELNAEPVFSSVTKYSKTVTKGDNLIEELKTAVRLAFDDIPGAVHLAIPIDVQLQPSEKIEWPSFPTFERRGASKKDIQSIVNNIHNKKGVLFIGNGARESVDEVIELAEFLEWPFVTTPMAKGLIPASHPLHRGVYGFAGHKSAVDLLHEGDHEVVMIFGSSLGETATSNYQDLLSAGRIIIQIDRDPSVFTRKYMIDYPVIGDCKKTIEALIKHKPIVTPYKDSVKEYPYSMACESGYNTKTVLPFLQSMLPKNTRFTVDIGEFMSYVIHYMEVTQFDSFDINVHYGSMGTGIGASIGLSLARPYEDIACITGDGCFFMHGMEILTAKEYNLPITFIVMNNSRLGMVHHGHSLQYKRVHERFSQTPVSIAAIAEAMDIPSIKISSLTDINQDDIEDIFAYHGPKIIEVEMVDDSVPPMGDRVKFLSSFAKNN